jgi:hypothetical protein
VFSRQARRSWGPSWRQAGVPCGVAEGSEDPWLCGPGFRRVCLCRGLWIPDLQGGTKAVKIKLGISGTPGHAPSGLGVALTREPAPKATRTNSRTLCGFYLSKHLKDSGSILDTVNSPLALTVT